MAMDEAELISNWSEQKKSHNYYCLIEPSDAEFEFCGRVGHPSQYAFVKFTAQPADHLSLSIAVEWPEEFDEVYALRIQHSIAEAVLDVLFSRAPGRVMASYRGCQLTLVKFGWHEVSGSEVAVRIATAKALEQLCERGKWRQITGRYRRYPADKIEEPKS